MLQGFGSQGVWRGGGFCEKTPGATAKSDKASSSQLQD